MSYEPLVEAQLADIASQIRHYVDDSIPSIEVRPGYVYRMWLMIDSSLTCVHTDCECSSSTGSVDSVQDTCQVHVYTLDVLCSGILLFT